MAGTYTAQGSVSICRVMLSDQCLGICCPPLLVRGIMLPPISGMGKSRQTYYRMKQKPQSRCANSWLQALCPDAQPLSEGSGGCKGKETLRIPGCPPRRLVLASWAGPSTCFKAVKFSPHSNTCDGGEGARRAQPHRGSFNFNPNLS